MTDRTFTLADSFDSVGQRIDLSAPLPLGYVEGIRRGLQLRARGTHMSYRVISEVMAEYHGLKRSTKWWTHHLRAHGAEPRPHGPQAYKPQHRQLFAGGLGGAALRDYLTRP